jgi:hypothetical protein
MAETTPNDFLHYGAGPLAKRCLGADTPENRRIIYRWQNELDPEQRPSFLQKIGRHLAAWESAIRRHAGDTAFNPQSSSPQPPS